MRFQRNSCKEKWPFIGRNADGALLFREWNNWIADLESHPVCVSRDFKDFPSGGFITNRWSLPHLKGLLLASELFVAPGFVCFTVFFKKINSESASEFKVPSVHVPSNACIDNKGQTRRVQDGCSLFPENGIALKKQVRPPFIGKQQRGDCCFATDARADLISEIPGAVRGNAR